MYIQMASEYTSFFSGIPEISEDTVLIFLHRGAVDRIYSENLAWFLGSRVFPRIVRVSEDQEDEAKLLARGEAYVKEKLGGGASIKYRLISGDPTDNKSLNEVIRRFFSEIMPTAFRYSNYQRMESERSWEIIPQFPALGGGEARKILYLGDPSKPKDNAKKRSLLSSFGKGQVEAVSSLEELYTIMASPTSPNITIYLTPEEAKKVNNNLFLGRKTAVFNDAEMAILRRPEQVIYLGNHYPPESISFGARRRELGVDFIGMYNPEDFLDLEADGDVGVIAENTRLARLAEGKGWHSVEVVDFNPLLGEKVAFLGSSKNLGRYRDAISKYNLKDLGPISVEDISKIHPSIVVMDGRDDEAALTAIKSFAKVWQLDQLLLPPEVGRCSSPPESGEEGKRKKKIGDEEDHRKITCENFLFDRLYRHPALPVPLPHPIDEKKAQEWVATHPMKYREMARDFIRSTHHVSFDDFYANLRRSTLASLERIGERPFTLLIAIEKGVLREKSNYWVSQLVWDFFEETKKFPVDVTDSVASTARKYPQIRDFIIADDAAYSGTQMRATLDRQLGNVLSAGKDEEEPPIRDIHLVIPYISERAAQVISPKEARGNQFRLSLYGQVKMAKLSEILSPEVVERMLVEGFIDGDRWPYYFDHKIADKFSSYPEKYGWGRIAGTKKSIIFLENCYTAGCFQGYYKNIF